MISQIAAQLARGFVMGAADIVPGVSGGTIAVLLGIYERLISSISNAAWALGRLLRGDVDGARTRFREVAWVFIVSLVVGILVAVAVLSSLLDRLLADYPEEMAGLFFGLVLASIVVALSLLKRPINPPRIALLIAVAVAAFFLLGLQSGPISDPSAIVFFGAGALAICAMILPGISGSFILLMIGMYAAVLHAVTEREMGDLLSFALGALVGIALFSSALTWLLERAHDAVLAVLIGLMVGSLRVLWPWPNGVGIISEEAEEAVGGTGLEWPAADELVIPALLAVIGFGVAAGLAMLSRRAPAAR